MPAPKLGQRNCPIRSRQEPSAIGQRLNDGCIRHQRTFGGAAAASESSVSFCDPLGDSEQRWRNFKSKHLGGLEVDQQR